MKKKFGALLVLAIGMMIAATGCGKKENADVKVDTAAELVQEESVEAPAENDGESSKTESVQPKEITSLDDFEGDVLAKLDETFQAELNTGYIVIGSDPVELTDLYSDFSLCALVWSSNYNSDDSLAILYKAKSISDGTEIILYQWVNIEGVTDADILSENKIMQDIFDNYQRAWYTCGSLDEFKTNCDKFTEEASLNRELEFKTF